MDVKTAARVIDVVEAFAALRRPLTLSDLAKELTIPVSSCLGLVRTLANRGYLYEVHRRGGFYPTGRLFAQAKIIAAHDPILDRVQPFLLSLRDQTDETIVLGKLKDREVVYLDVLESERSVRYTAQIGVFRPVFANSIGKALLGVMDVETRKDFIASLDLHKLTEHTLGNPRALQADLDKSQKRGWYSNLGESASDLGAIARPIRLANDWYGISVAGPLYRIKEEIDAHARALADICATIEQTS